MRRREAPVGHAVLVFEFGEPLAVGLPGAEPARNPGGFLARVSARPAVTEFAGVCAGVQVDLSPVAARMLAGMPMGELPEPAVGLADLLGRKAAIFAERLHGAAGWEERFDLVDEFLASELARAEAPPASIEWALASLVASGGGAAIGTLSRRIGCSDTHLVQGFRDAVGVTPKTVASILRFERASRALRRPQARPLAALAVECGYHDQSHMTRDFSRFAGVTPAAYSRAAGFPGLGVGEFDSVQDVAAPSS